jgi:hypothetical protein
LPLLWHELWSTLKKDKRRKDHLMSIKGGETVFRWNDVR